MRISCGWEDLPVEGRQDWRWNREGGGLGIASMAVGKRRQQITLIKRKLVCKSSEREDRWRGEGRAREGEAHDVSSR